MSVDEFRAKFAEAAGFPEEPAETPVETTDTVDEVEVPEPETEAAEEPAVVDEPEAEVEEQPDEDKVALEAYLAKYGGDTDAALRAAVEAQKIIGRQSAEVAEARKVAEQVTELRALVEAQQTVAEPASLSYDPEQVDDWLLQNPHQIPGLAQQAIDTEDGFLYQRTLAAWAEVDAVGAMDFHARKVSEANMAQLREEMQPALKQVERTQTGNQFVVAYEAAAAKHDDFSQVMNSITPENIAGFPKTVLAALQSGDQASKQEVLETLYRWTKAEQAGNITQAATTAARKQQQDSRTARTDAAVASASTSQSREATTGIDAFHEQFQASDAFRKAAGLA